ncbi:hypothetical protein POTOM_054870 [Populus tomentosa]|uniref:Uncharacterized protein n=1 Tax=Populus tomentosa TaxID=118781 RepID=A0A8X7Y048_POPTO|nr:hypothetical protein POTOM_054870 [Populus tomentosa]
MFPNSTTLVLAGSWNNSPGDRTMNKTTATTTGGGDAKLIEKEESWVIKGGKIDEDKPWKKNIKETISCWCYGFVFDTLGRQRPKEQV